MMDGKKKKIRKMRGDNYVVNKDGSPSSHRMSYGEESKGYSVNPTLFPKKSNPSHSADDWEHKSGLDAYEEAKKRGEVVYFKSKKRASKMASGAWKKGRDRREAMKRWRKEEKPLLKNRKR